jgi:nucleoside-diphosphate-sugar epimerase
MTAGTEHVVLGGTGAVARETIGALARRGIEATAVSRHPAVSERVRTATADLLSASDAVRALSGAEVAYFAVGLPYSAPIWEAQWPRMLRNTIDAALQHGTHLVYFDNVYAYGTVAGPMTESTPIKPCSRKGRVRADALLMLSAAATESGLVYSVGRSADFYGPGASTSAFNTFALDPIAAGRSGTWLLDADQPHSLTFTPDIGEALAIIGTDPRARGHVWHVPTAPALTGREYIELAAKAPGRAKVMGAAMLAIGGVFLSSARETREMAYQYTAPYLFDSTAFESAFGTLPTSSADGIGAALATLAASGSVR